MAGWLRALAMEGLKWSQRLTTKLMALPPSPQQLQAHGPPPLSMDVPNYTEQ